ncbi:hypothetical protein ACFL1C_03750 [Pseudomonadota bacterium]
MHQSPKLLILDERSDRRERLAMMASRFGCIRVDPLGEIGREDFEKGAYDVAFVHYNNKEGMDIEDVWVSPGTKIVFFSGGFDMDIDEDEGFIYVKDQIIQNEGNLKQILQRVLAP